jgi:hypothetical protein
VSWTTTDTSWKGAMICASILAVIVWAAFFWLLAELLL